MDQYLRKTLIIIILMTFKASYSQTTSDYLVTKKGEVINMYPNIKNKYHMVTGYSFKSAYAVTNQFIYYHNNKGKLKKVKSSKLSNAYLSGVKYTNYKIGQFGWTRLHEIIAESDDYILTLYFSTSYYIYLIDKSTGEFVYKKHRVRDTQLKDQETYKEKILPYFKNCPLFLNALIYNIKNNAYEPSNYANQKYMFLGVTNFNCP